MATITITVEAEDHYKLGMWMQDVAKRVLAGETHGYPVTTLGAQGTFIVSPNKEERVDIQVPPPWPDLFPGFPDLPSDDDDMLCSKCGTRCWEGSMVYDSCLTAQMFGPAVDW